MEAVGGEVCKINNGKDWKKLGTGNIPVYNLGVALYKSTHAEARRRRVNLFLLFLLDNLPASFLACSSW